MDKSESLKILKQLADGVDPYTGEILPDCSPYQQPQTVRALFQAIIALEGVRNGPPHPLAPHPLAPHPLAPSPSLMERGKRNEGMKETTQKAASGPANAGRSWEQAEDEQLKAAFDQGMSIKELAYRHQRTVGAIEARLVRLGKVPSREYARAMFSGKSQ